MKKDQKTENRHHWKGHGVSYGLSLESQFRITTQTNVERFVNAVFYNDREN